MSFLTNLLKWKVPRLTTDAGGNTVLVGADGQYPIVLSYLISVGGSVNAAGGGVDNPVQLTAAYDPHVLLAADEILIPSDATHVSVIGNFDFSANSTGTYREVTIQVYAPSLALWVSAFPVIVPVAGSLATRVNPSLYLYKLSDIGAAISKLRVTARHDATAGLILSGGASVTFVVG